MKLRSGVPLAMLVLVCACRGAEKPPPPESPPSITSFTVNQQSIRRGEMVTFSFTVVRAKGVELVDQFGVPVTTTFDDLTGVGSAKASPDRTSFFVLRAEGLGGRDTSFLQVSVDEGLRSVFLIAVPAQVKPGERVELVWAAEGGTNVQLTAGTRTLSTMPSGAMSDTPGLTTTYNLTGQRADGSTSTQRVTVTVVPTVQEFTATPAAALPGQTITLNWKTAGAEEVVIDEASFGQLHVTRADVATGSFAFVVPSAFADGGFDAGVPMVVDGGTTDGGTDGGTADAGSISQLAVREGFPLRFTLSAKTTTPAQVTQRSLEARVGRGPLIEVFEAPAFGTRGRTVPLAWRTVGATQVELRANGYTVYTSPLGINTTGGFSFGNFGAQTTFTLVARDSNGLEASASRVVGAVAPPRVVSFMTPMATATATMKVTVTWMTEDATFVLLRAKGGPAFFRDDGVNSVRAGTAQFFVPQKGTYVIEAWNAAGAKDSVERVIDVGAPIVFTITPDLLARGDVVTTDWDVSLLAPSSVSGLSGAVPPAVVNANAFDDLTTVATAKTLAFANRDDDAIALDLPNGFTFPFVTRQARRLTISTNGFVAIGTSAPLPTNADLTDVGYAGPPLIAPFWDDLELGVDGKVLWDLDEGAIPRRLVISWHDVKRVGAVDSKLTFQVQLFENGKFLFVWKKLDGAGADGSDATIGVVDAVDVYQGQVSFNSSTSAELAVDTERQWFTSTTEFTGQRQFRIRAPSVLGFVVETATDQVPVYGKARAFGPNEVPITEAMPAPLMSVSAGQWVELSNPSDEEVDISGLRLESISGAANPFVMPADTVIAPKGFLVLGETIDATMNGDAGVRVPWGTGVVTMTVPDGVRLFLPTPLSDGGLLTVGALDWGGFRATLPDGGLEPDAGTVEVGVSVSAPENVLVRTGAPPFTCPQSGTFGPPEQVGTPGAANPECFPYKLTEIPFDFTDISPTGLALTTTSWDDSIVLLTIPTFTYFGQAFTQVTVSTNGWVAFGSAPDSNLTNKTRPSGSTPVATVAPFWEDLVSTTLPNSIIYAQRRTGVSIVQWNRAQVWDSPRANDDMTFQIKFFDSGEIEFHYAAMISGSSTNAAAGGTATRWIENLDGTAALAIGVAQPTVRSNSAFRFTPRANLGGTP